MILFEEIYFDEQYEDKNSQLEIIFRRLEKREYDKVAKALRPVYSRLNQANKSLAEITDCHRIAKEYRDNVRNAYSELFKLID